MSWDDPLWRGVAAGGRMSYVDQVLLVGEDRCGRGSLVHNECLHLFWASPGPTSLMHQNMMVVDYCSVTLHAERNGVGERSEGTGDASGEGWEGGIAVSFAGNDRGSHGDI